MRTDSPSDDPQTEAPRRGRPKAATRTERTEAFVAEHSTVPREMREYFEGRGIRLSLASMHPNEVRRRARHQFFLLDLDSDVPDEARREQFKKALVKSGFRYVEGSWRGGDTGIFTQTIAQHRALGFDAYKRYVDTIVPDLGRDARTIADAAGAMQGLVVEPMTSGPGGGSTLHSARADGESNYGPPGLEIINR